MITKDQVEQLSRLYQMDRVTILREYLQLVFLSYLYQERGVGEIFFKGGTALRLLFDSPRFSEDLDFTTVYKDEEIKRLLGSLEKKLTRELPGLKIASLYTGKAGIRFKVKYNWPDLKYPLNIRLDFHRENKVEDQARSSLTTRFPILIFPQINHLSKETILKEKLRALATRCKGRDLFDVWFLLAKGMELQGVKYDRKKVMEKVRVFSQTRLSQDLNKFLPKGQRGIVPELKRELVDRLGY